MDILTQVRTRLQAKKGRLREIAAESGISYDTVLRIKNGEGDPGFSKVQALHQYLKGGRAA